MNIQLTSNCEVKGRVNYTNEFEIPLQYPIDAQGKDVYIEVLDVSYPKTIKNVTKNDGWFSLKIGYFNFKRSEDYLAGGNFAFETKKIIIPEGTYTIDPIISFMNNSMEEFDVYLTRQQNGKIEISCNLNCEYWVNQTTSKKTTAHDGGTLGITRLSKQSRGKKIGVFGYQKLIDTEVDLTMSKKLAFMLGFSNATIEFENENNADNLTFKVIGDHMPDKTDGLNMMFVYCPELEHSIISNYKSELLLTIPIEWQNENDDSQLYFFQPSSTKRKFKKMFVQSLNISLHDTNGVLIPFDSGTITINAILHDA